MIGLFGARVIIVDDDVKDALPILKAFAQRGIPAAFFDGGEDALPPGGGLLWGVRLAILDMALTPGVPDEAKVSQLLKLLERILSPENGPYLALVWTNHPELKPLFEDHLFNRSNVPKPVLTVMFAKADFKDGESFNLKRLTRRIDERLAEASPFLLLQSWEGRSAESTTEVTNGLSILASGVAPNLMTWQTMWKDGMLRLMRALAEAEAGKALTRESCLAAVYRILDPLHADRMESGITSELKEKLSATIDEVMQSVGDASPDAPAKLNTMMHLALQEDRFFAGCIYRATAKANPRGAPTKRALLKDLLQPAAKEQMEGVFDRSIHVIVECNAACDHAQNKIRVARYVAGVLVPEADGNMVKRADFIWKHGPLFLQGRAIATGAYWLCLSALHMVTLDLRSARELNPIARLRSQVFADLQAWLSRHIARPGVLRLE